MKALYKRSGLLAIVASAIGETIDAPDARAPAGFVDGGSGLAVVTISGPLTHHPEHGEHGECFDNYDDIRTRVAAALNSSAHAVVLKINSPGGDATGCLELARDLRGMADQTGKKLYAYADGMAASASYAIACGAHEIYAPLTATIGSIGVVQTLADVTAADRSAGLNIKLVASGARKTDGNIHVPLSDDSLAAAQVRVDALAELFFELVAEARRIPVAAVRALEAGIFHGAAALGHGLLNGVCSFKEVLALASGMNAATAAAKEPMNLKQMLQAVIDGDGTDDEKDEARKALAAISGEEDKPAEEDKPDAEGDDEEPAAADDAPPAKDDEKPKEDAKAVASLAARMTAFEQKAEREKLIASRPDLVKSKAFLNSLPLASLRKAVVDLPRVAVPKLAAAASVAGVTADKTGASASHLPPSEAHDLDVAMGLSRSSRAIRNEGTRLFLGVMRPSEAREEIAVREATATRAALALKGGAQ